MLTQGSEMMRRAVSLIGGQSVNGKHRVPLPDHAIALNLSQDRGRSDGCGKRVAVNDGPLRQIAVQPQRIDQQMVGAGF